MNNINEYRRLIRPGASVREVPGALPDLERDAGRTFDVVVLSDLLAFPDIGAALRSLRPIMRPDSRLIVTMRRDGWLGRDDLLNLLDLADFSVEPEVGAVVVARPRWHERPPARELTCTVVVPCKNERGNIAGLFARVPELGAGTELLFVDGSSDDGTVAEIERLLPTRPGARLLHQGDGRGKGDAVRKGFAAATGEALFILDADLTVAPEDLPAFYRVLAERKADFANGSRLVYPMEGEAMRFLNHLGNRFFSAAFTWILERPISDTLCGTKALTRASYARIAAGRAYFGDFDPFGDFDLLFGAARAGLTMIDVPVRYRARTYGETKISRFRHGWLLLEMTAFAFVKLKLRRG